MLGIRTAFFSKFSNTYSRTPFLVHVCNFFLLHFKNQFSQPTRPTPLFYFPFLKLLTLALMQIRLGASACMQMCTTAINGSPHSDLLHRSTHQLSPLSSYSFATMVYLQITTWVPSRWIRVKLLSYCRCHHGTATSRTTFSFRFCFKTVYPPRIRKSFSTKLSRSILNLCSQKESKTSGGTISESKFLDTRST